MERYVPDHESSRVLMIGSGSDVELSITEQFDVRFCSNASREYFGSASGRIEGRVLERLPELTWKDGSFDCVCLFDVLEHVEDDGGALSEVHRVLKPNGKLVLTVPALSMLWTNHDVISGHHRRYNRGQLRTILQESSFSLDVVTYFNTLLFPIVMSVRLIQKLLPSDEGGGFMIDRPGTVNSLLKGVFGLEANLLRFARFPVGVSLLAVVEKSTPS